MCIPVLAARKGALCRRDMGRRPGHMCAHRRRPYGPTAVVNGGRCRAAEGSAGTRRWFRPADKSGRRTSAIPAPLWRGGSIRAVYTISVSGDVIFCFRSANCWPMAATWR
ncbi:hypothetical protein GCM10010300_79740 [Streptomyces olivaceoviridis]|nr:hypothetical protein GCM10010300_79740 [Streptomyces olivaceoviridis]